MNQDIVRTDRPQTIRRIFKGEIEDTDKSKRTVVSVITTDAIDRYREAVLAKGIALDNFRENPVVLWCHNSTVVIGKNLWIKRFSKDGKNGLIAKTLFAKTDKAEEIFQLYCDGFLNGWSIGANPDWAAYGAPTEDECKARPDFKKCRCVYRKCELVEYSACSIPANPDALGNEIGKGLSVELRRELEAATPWDEIYEKEPIEAVAKKDLAPQLPPLVVLPALVGRTFHQALAQTRGEVARLTSKSAAETAARNTIDRAKGRV